MTHAGFSQLHGRITLSRVLVPAATFDLPPQLFANPLSFERVDVSPKRCGELLIAGGLGLDSFVDCQMAFRSYSR